MRRLMILSKTVAENGSREIGLWLFTAERSSKGFFSNGKTVVCFQAPGRVVDKVEVFRMGVSMVLICCSPLEFGVVGAGVRCGSWEDVLLSGGGFF